MLFFSLFIIAQNENSEPSFYSEIGERVTKKHFVLDTGIPQKIMVNDTVFLGDYEK